MASAKLSAEIGGTRGQSFTSGTRGGDTPCPPSSGCGSVSRGTEALLTDGMPVPPTGVGFTGGSCQARCPRVPPGRVFLGSPRQECFPLPSESGGRNCWNSDGLSNSANFILRTKGSVPAGAGGRGHRRGPCPEFPSRRPPAPPQPPRCSRRPKAHFQQQREAVK